jgi:uncharacterized protein (TIGR03382 family)
MWCSSCGSFLPDHKPANAVAGLGVLRITAKQPGGGRGTVTTSAAAAGAFALLALGAARLRRRKP